jgi:hypothetical protein
MNRKTIWSSGLTLMAVALLAVPARLKAGPPLLCHSLNIGNAKSLPWGAGAHWNADDANYDLSHLVADTLTLLDSQTPVIVRMETLRRATLYAQHDRFLAKELLGQLHQRAFAGEASLAAGGRPAALAWFDYGYLVECYKQTGWMPGSHGQGSSQAELAASLDGYGAVEKAIALRSPLADGPQMEFAAALIGLEGHKPGQRAHAQKAAAAVSKGQDGLLTENLYNVPFLGRENAATALMGTTMAKN